MLFAQELLGEKQRAIFDSKYGSDASLIEGKVYAPETNVLDGDPFWGISKLYTGTIVLQGKKYVNQQLKYDLFNQNFILIYKETIGAEKQIIIGSDKIDTVYINGAVFIPNPIAKIEKRYVQLVYEGNIAVYVVWSKQKTIDQNSNTGGYSFTKEMNTKYIIFNNTLYSINSNRKLLKLFSGEYRKKLRLYLANKKIRMKNVDQEKLKGLSAYIDGLIMTI